MKVIVLLGYMGSGKSVVGQLLSQLLGVSHIDLDYEIERQEKKSISQIFEEKGAIYFRKKEYEVLKELLLTEDLFVLSLGGGTPCYYPIMDQELRHPDIFTIYLDTSIPTLTHRLFEEKNHRPLISSVATKEELAEFIGKHLFERRPHYRKAKQTIRTDELTPEQIASQIQQLLF